MAVPLQRSRYPRPLKAMHTFAAGSGGGGGQGGQGGNGASSPVAPSTPTAASNGGGGGVISPAAAPLKNGHSSPPPACSVGRRCGCSVEGKGCSRGEGGRGEERILYGCIPDLSVEV